MQKGKSSSTSRIPLMLPMSTYTREHSSQHTPDGSCPPSLTMSLLHFTKTAPRQSCQNQHGAPITLTCTQYCFYVKCSLNGLRIAHVQTAEESPETFLTHWELLDQIPTNDGRSSFVALYWSTPGKLGLIRCNGESHLSHLAKEDDRTRNSYRQIATAGRLFTIFSTFFCKYHQHISQQDFLAHFPLYSYSSSCRRKICSHSAGSHNMCSTTFRFGSHQNCSKRSTIYFSVLNSLDIHCAGSQENFHLEFNPLWYIVRMI